MAYNLHASWWSSWPQWISQFTVALHCDLLVMVLHESKTGFTVILPDSLYIGCKLHCSWPRTCAQTTLLIHDNSVVITVNTINFYSNLIHCHVLCMVCLCDILGVALSVQDKGLLANMWLWGFFVHKEWYSKPHIQCIHGYVHSTYVLNTTSCRYFMQEVRISQIKVLHKVLETRAMSSFVMPFSSLVHMHKALSMQCVLYSRSLSVCMERMELALSIHIDSVLEQTPVSVILQSLLRKPVRTDFLLLCARWQTSAQA